MIACIVAAVGAIGGLNEAGCVGDSGAPVDDHDSGTDAAAPADASGNDGSTMDAGGDAADGGRCDPTKPFTNKRLLDNINSLGSSTGGTRLLADEKTAYFSSNHDGGVGGFDIYVATRASSLDPFSSGLLLNGGNTTNDETTPAPTSDGLYIYAAAPGPGGNDVVVAKRSTTAAPFSSFAPLSGIATAEDEDAPYVLPDQSALYFHADRASGGVGSHDIYRASHLGGGVFAAPVLVPGINTAAAEVAPVVTSNELVMYFSSGGGAGSYDAWVARRPTTASAFGTRTNVTELNTAQPDFVDWVSDDDCVIVYETSALPDGGNSGTYSTYVAERPQ